MGKRWRQNRLRKRLLAQGGKSTLLALSAESCHFEAAPAEDAKKGPRRFEMLAYNGGPVKPPGWRFPVVIELAGMGTTSRPKVFLEHDEKKRVGHIDRINVTDRQISASGLISASGPAAKEVLDDADAGFPWDVSVGVRPLQVEWVPPGKTARANRQQFTGPLNLFRRSELFEISFVSMGADKDTSVSIAAGRKLKELDMEFSAWLKAKGFDEAQLNEVQTQSLRAMCDAEQEPDDDVDGDPAPGKKPVKAGGGAKGPQGDDPQEITAQLRADAAKEIKRQNMIRLKAARFPDLQATAMEEGWDETKVELEVLRASRPKAPAIHSRGDDGDAYPQVLEAALCRTARVAAQTVEESYDEKVLEAADARDLKGAGLHTLIYETIRLAGKHVRAGRMTEDVIRMAFECDRDLRASGSGFSTYSLSGILSNVQNKVLLQAFLAVPVVSPEICGVRSASDFKSVTSYRMTATGAFEQVGPTGELKHLSLDEDSFSNQVKTVGGILQLARNDIINDDLGALTGLSQYLGRRSAIAREKAVFTRLLSNPGSFFSAGNKNILTGGTSVLSISGLTLGEQLFMDQVDKNGDPILVAPAILLVPTGLKVTAQQLMTETRVNEAATAGSPKPANNPHAGKWQPKVSPYINAQGLTGSSATKWWLLADPADVAVMQLIYLNGRDTPIIEMGEPNFDTLGVAIRGYYDFGENMQDPKGGIQSNGA
jgi:hypothetical protein